MGVYRRAFRRGDWNFDGMHLLRSCLATNVVASSSNCDVQFDYCLRVHSRCTEPDSPRNPVACDYQRYFVRCRIGLVFLFQTKRRRSFSGIERSITDCKGEAACFPKRWTRDADSAPIENFHARLAHRSIAATRSLLARAPVASRTVKAPSPPDCLRPVRHRWRWLAAPNR